MADNQYGDIGSRTASYASKEMLKRAIPYSVLEQAFSLRTLPANNTKSISARRYKLPIPTSASVAEISTANEGLTPASLSLEVEDYSLDLKQYGETATITDVVMDTHEDPVLMETVGSLGERVGQIVEWMRWQALIDGTSSNIVFSGSATSDATVALSITATELRKAVRQMRAAHAKYITKIAKSSVNYDTYNIEPAFIAYMNSDLEPSLRVGLGDDFKAVSDYGTGTQLLVGEFGKFENVRFVSSTMIGKRANAGQAIAGATTLLSDAGTNVNLYDIILMGESAAWTVALKGKHAVSPLVVNAKPSDSDPLAQRTKVGYKTMQGAKVVQPAHLKRITCGALK